MHVIGDVDGRNVLIVDDIIDTAGTLTKTVEALTQARAPSGSSPPASTACSPARRSSASTTSPLEQVLITNTTPVDEKLARMRRSCGRCRSRRCSARRSAGSTRTAPSARCSSRVEASEGDHESGSHHRSREARNDRQGRQPAGCARAELIPAVVYGGGKERGRHPGRRASSCSTSSRTAAARTRSSCSSSRGTDKSRHAMIRDMQVDPITDQVSHIDFQRIDMIDREGPRQGHRSSSSGIAYGVKTEGGVLDFVTREVEVECLPTAIPHGIDARRHRAPDRPALEVRAYPGCRRASPCSTTRTAWSVSVAHAKIEDEAPAARPPRSKALPPPSPRSSPRARRTRRRPNRSEAARPRPGQPRRGVPRDAAQRRASGRSKSWRARWVSQGRRGKSAVRSSSRRAKRALPAADLHEPERLAASAASSSATSSTRRGAPGRLRRGGPAAGRLRLRPSGSPGGHRGLESIDREPAAATRCRGCGSAWGRCRPELAEGEDLAEFVLSPFLAEERAAAEAHGGPGRRRLRVSGSSRGSEAAMNRFNGPELPPEALQG